MATKVKPSRIKVTGNPQAWQVPVYVNEDNFEWKDNWEVFWPASSTDWNIVLFDWATGKKLKDSWKKTSDYQEKLTAQTAYTAKGTSSKVPQITTNSLWQVTAITEVNINYPSQVSDTSYAASWDGVTDVAPSKNAVYDKVESVEWEISTINGLIPVAATTSNQLADKDFVNNGINSVTAYYITKNANWDQFATYAELSSATTFYSGWVVRVPTRNDYTIVLADENHDNATTRYIYNSWWEYQYTVNETALTQAQLDALNSGITANKVSTYDWYATSKQNTLATQTAYTSKGTSTKVPTISTNSLGQVTSISETNISFPVTSVNGWTGDITWLQTTANLKTSLSDNSDSYYPSQKAVKTAVDSKQDSLATQTAYTSKGTATKVPTITTNTLWQVTAITETAITFPVTSVNWSTWAVTGLQTTANLKTGLSDNSDTYYPSQKAVKTAVDGKQDKSTSWSWAPSSTPTFVGQLYVDSTNDKMYFATGTSSSSDWTLVGSWSWMWDVTWPASSTDSDIVLFDWTTWKIIKDWNKKLADLVQTSWNQTIAWTKTFSTSPVVPSKTTDATNTWTAVATEAQVYKKQDKLTAQTAYTSKWNASKVPQITTNSLWQVTWITEVNITYPSQVSDTAYGNWWDWDTTTAPSKNAVYDKISAMDTTISWKQNSLSTQTAYTSKGSATKVPQITTNTLWQVTWITEVTITQPTKVSDLQNDSWFITWITSWDVTTALWYTPYNSSNPSWYTSNTWDVVWPASSTNWHLAVFDWATWKIIKDWWLVPTGVPSWWTNWDVLTNVSGTPTWAAPSWWIINDTTGTTSTVTGIWAWSEAEYTSLGSKSWTVLYFTF